MIVIVAKVHDSIEYKEKTAMLYKTYKLPVVGQPRDLFMRLTLSGLGLLLSAFVAGCSPSDSVAKENQVTSASVTTMTEGMVTPDPSSQQVSRGLVAFSSQFHFDNRPITDELALEAADMYVDFLDSGKSYLLKADVDAFYQIMKSDGRAVLISGELAPAYQLYNKLMSAVEQRTRWIEQALAEPVDLELGGELLVDWEAREFAATPAAQDEFWQRRLVSETIGLMLSEDLSQTEAQAKLLKRYQSFERRLTQRKPSEVFQSWVNAQLGVFGPHTIYYSPRSKEDFDINMSLSLEGIGARLSEIDGIVTIIELIPGGPAQRSAQLAPRDRIVSVGQGKKGELVDVVNWRVDDVVDLVRGKRGSIVRLGIHTPSGDQKVVQLERDKIDLDAQAAKEKVVSVTNEMGAAGKIGIIELPAFYADFSGETERSSAADVKKAVESLMKQSVDAILLDLRNNGGGSLDEAVDIAGLFLPKGSPVVQVHTSGGDTEINKTRHRAIYDGPLAILIDRSSASASEILAAVIQDQGRGLIIGQTSFGKGTVQNLIGLQRFLSTTNRGQVKITTAKFYRISGGSTQNKGVEPDIVLPSLIDAEEVGESSHHHAMPWSKIAPVLYKPSSLDSALLRKIQQRSDARRETSPGFAVLAKEQARLDYFRDRKTLPVSLSARQRLNAEEEAEKLAIDNAWRALEGKPPLEALEVESEEDRIIRSTLDEESPDPWLEEAAQIVLDFIQSS